MYGWVFSATQPTIDRSGTNDWYGVVINSSSGSSSQINYATIKNADYGVLIYGASPTVSNTKINYCDIGIYISGGAPKFSVNTITYSDYNGVSCFSGASPSFGTYPNYGDNVIRRNGDRGIYAAYYCNVFLGQNTSPPSGGRNSIYENYNPSGFQISILYGSTSMADISFQKAEYDSAIQISGEIITTSPSSQEALSALNIHRLASIASGKAEFQAFINNVIAQHSGEELAGVARLNWAWYLVSQKNFAGALDQLQENVNSFPRSSLEKISLFQKGMIFLFDVDDRKGAEVAFAELQKKYPDDPLVVEAQRLLGQANQHNSPKQLAASNVGDQIILHNFPNPCNPTTEFRYVLPEAGKVTLRIFNWFV